jgi:plastocyanin
MRHKLALAMIATLLAAGCAADDGDSVLDDAAETTVSQDTETDGSAAPPAAEDEEEAATVVPVTIGDFFFEPDTLTVAVGDTVTWTHDGDITHNVTARDDSFVSDNLSSGETFTHTFAEAGSFEYRCTLHTQMIASVEVS